MTGQKISCKKILQGIEQAREARRWKRKPFLLENDPEKFLSSLSRQLSETKPRTSLILLSRDTLLYLEFNKPNKHYVSEINLFKEFNFSQCQNNCWHTEWCQEWNIKTSHLKIGKINT